MLYIHQMLCIHQYLPDLLFHNFLVQFFLVFCKMLIHLVFELLNRQYLYKVKIHINGNYHVGTYNDLNQAAIAYNKAVDIVKKQGYDKNYDFNYIEGLSPARYAQMYSECSISDKLYHLIL